MIQESSADHGSSVLPLDAINTPKTFHLQPRADEGPATLSSSSGLVAHNSMYQQTPASTAIASQLLLLPVLAMWLKALWPAIGNVGRNAGSHRKRSLGHSTRQHARSWSTSNILTQESLD